jgi:endonuclease/exonuclease/phosphatase family metal-dependent hydrolase
MKYLNSILLYYKLQIKMVTSMISVMTWNIWFDKTNRRSRTETLLNEIKSFDPDILALQEVVEESLEIIIAKMKPTYYIIGMNPSGFPSGYDTLILSKFPPINWDRYYLPNTKMGRNLLLTTLQTSKKEISVGTFHLESVFNKRNKTMEELKKSQLKYIYAISPMNSILMGDTNLIQDEDPCSLPSPESPKCPNNPPIIDVFYMSILPPSPPPPPPPISSILESAISKHIIEKDRIGLGICPFQKGEGTATYCGKTNKNVKDKSIQSRLDRIYIKIKRNSLKVHFYGITGTITQPSDHYGVFSQIEI